MSSDNSSRTPPRRPAPSLKEIVDQKPRMVVKTGEARREAEREHARKQHTWWSLAVRLLPVWIMIAIILVIAPALPLQIVSSAIRVIGSLIPDVPAQRPAEPVFIVEGAEGSAPITSQLPPPNWDLAIATIFTPQVQFWADDIARWSVEYRVKPNMIATVMQIESCGDPSAVSNANAFGLFQVLSDYFTEGEDPFNPDNNARHAMLLLGELYAMTNGDPGLIFAGYNGGAGVLTISPVEWPTETQNYQFWASGIYEEAELALRQSPTLEDWLRAGGSALCEQASVTQSEP